MKFADPFASADRAVPSIPRVLGGPSGFFSMAPSGSPDFSSEDKTMNTSQCALVRAARSCSNEAAKAARLGQRRFAGQLRASARRAFNEAAGEGADVLVKAVACVKNAVALAADLPDRGRDADTHDATVKGMHIHVKNAKGFLEQHLNPMNPKSRRRRRGNETGPSGPSGTDNDVAYDAVSGDSNLLRALDSLRKADVEADHLVDVLDDENEADRSTVNLHFHVKSADESLQNYRDTTLNNPEAEKRRSIARAWARVVAVGLH